MLARFRAQHQDALIGLLTETLVLAAELGMVSLGVVAFDGTKIAANASRDANRGEAGLRRLAEEYLGAVAETDAAEDAEFGEQARGDEVPEPVRDRSRRRERIDEALAAIAARRGEAEHAEREQAERAAAYTRAATEPGAARTGRPPVGVDAVAVAKARWERARAAAQTRYEDLLQRRARRAERGPGPSVGRPPVPVDDQARVHQAYATYQAAQAAQAARDDSDGESAEDNGNGGGNDGGGVRRAPRANLTDPHSRLLKTRNGWVQGYNCQTTISADEFLVIARATQDANDCAQFTPTVEQLSATVEYLAERTGRTDLVVGTMLGDAGYDSDTNLTAPGPERLIADAKRHVIDQRAATDPTSGPPPPTAGPREAMNHRWPPPTDTPSTGSARR